VAEEVRFLGITEVVTLLRAVANSGTDNRDLMTYLALALFAGVRRAEILRSTVRDIDFDARPPEFIVPLGKLSAKVSAKPRSRKRRVIPMENVCVEWLLWAGVDLREPGEKLIRPNFRRRWDRARSCLSAWPANVLRHTFPTYHYAFHRNESELQAILGHDSKDTLVEHYRGLARRADADVFLSLGPGRVLNDGES
jgi:integrase